MVPIDINETFTEKRATKIMVMVHSGTHSPKHETNNVSTERNEMKRMRAEMRKSAELPISNRKSFNRLYAVLCSECIYGFNFSLHIRNVCVCGMCVRF